MDQQRGTDANSHLEICVMQRTLGSRFLYTHSFTLSWQSGADGRTSASMNHHPEQTHCRACGRIGIELNQARPGMERERNQPRDQEHNSRIPQLYNHNITQLPEPIAPSGIPFQLTASTSRTSDCRCRRLFMSNSVARWFPDGG